MVSQEKVPQGLLSFILGCCKIVLLCRLKLRETLAWRKMDRACVRRGDHCCCSCHFEVPPQLTPTVSIYGRVSAVFKHLCPLSAAQRLDMNLDIETLWTDGHFGLCKSWRLIIDLILVLNLSNDRRRHVYTKSGCEVFCA